MKRGLPCAILLCTDIARADAGESNDLFGPLRARDLTPFGYLRLDMRPSDIAAGNSKWTVDAELAYQNTWALSPRVEEFLSELPGRHKLGSADLAALRALPGENYLIDVELGQLDLTFDRRFARNWHAYAIVSAAHYGGGFLDGLIEDFHHTFGFATFGRPAVRRNDVNLLLDLKSVQYASLGESPSSGGFLDPTVGLAYTGLSLGDHMNVSLEVAAKVPLAGRRPMLSTGRMDVGAQVTLDRVWSSQALQASLSVVRYAGNAPGDVMPPDARVIPTFVFAYEQRLSSQTSTVLQAYVSPSVYDRRETELRDLLATKYQLSLGLRHRIGAHAVTFAVTENLENMNNTPDIGFQLGWAYAGRPAF